MTQPTAATPTAPKEVHHSRRNLILALIGAAIVGAIAVGGFGIWYLFFRSAGPAAVAGAPPVFPATTVPAPSALDGEWRVDTSLGSMSDNSASFTGYRVQENLAGVGGQVAVGRSPKVSGSLTLRGPTIDNVHITADLTALASDDPSRDSQLTRQAIETERYPTAEFRTTGPIDLASLPADGQAIQVTAGGEFTLHGVTRTIQVPLSAERRGGIIAVTGTLEVTFGDYGVIPPSSLVVLSVADHGTMELHLLFTHV
jgi:polyisoprenoid-binding protein YceI